MILPGYCMSLLLSGYESPHRDYQNLGRNEEKHAINCLCYLNL
jgi:hypothetical protein